MAALTVEESSLLQESKYRSYRDAMAGVLETFDRSREWADLIKALNRVAKILAKYSRYPVVPEKVRWLACVALATGAAVPGLCWRCLGACARARTHTHAHRWISLYPLFPL